MSHRNEQNGISLLGSTGSIGTQTLSVCQHLGLRPCALAAGSNISLLEQQIRQFHPELAVVYDKELARQLKTNIRDLSVEVDAGMEGLLHAASLESASTVVTAVVGNIGLKPTLEAIRCRKRIALANKETLVCAGDLVMEEAEKANAEILPVDSEHSAIWQCLESCRDRKEAKRILLTASGGPFFGYTPEQLRKVSLTEALHHPNWQMGAKVTVDSATLINKGLEFIEAMRLYKMDPEQITVVVHRESVVHSAVEFQDGSVMAQMGVPDMRLPIQYALTYPDRMKGIIQELDLFQIGNLHFAPPDLDTFIGLKAAIKAAKLGGTACVTLNAANEQAVSLLLQEKIPFYRVPELVSDAVDSLPVQSAKTLNEIWEADRLAREYVLMHA